MDLSRVNTCKQGNAYNPKYLKHRDERWVHPQSITVGVVNDPVLGLSERKKCLVCSLEFVEITTGGLVR